MEQRRIFISHNTKWQFIGDFANLIHELGYYPVVVENEPDLGMDPNEKSRYYMDSSDIVVFVITKDTVDSSGTPHPKSNVALEIGLAEDKFAPQEKIFLVEDDAQPPSMVTKTYIRVGQANYYAAIARLVKNIRSVLPHPQYEESPAVELDEIEEYIVSQLAEHTRGEEARPVLLELLAKRFSIDQKRFNIIRFGLQEKGVILEGEIGIGHDHSGDLYLKLTGLGWRLASELESTDKANYVIGRSDSPMLLIDTSLIGSEPNVRFTKAFEQYPVVQSASFRLRNDGNGPALNLELKVWQGSSELKRAVHPSWKQRGIHSSELQRNRLAPGETLECFFSAKPGFALPEEGEPLSVRVVCSDIHNQRGSFHFEAPTDAISALAGKSQTLSLIEIKGFESGRQRE